MKMNFFICDEVKLNCNLCRKFFACVLVLGLLTRPAMPEVEIQWKFTPAGCNTDGQCGPLPLFATPKSGEEWQAPLRFVWNSTGREWRLKDRTGKVPGPEVEELEGRVVAVAGRDAVLPCRVANLNDKVVSWIRTRDLHILTSGPVTFTADDRFESSHDESSADWGLRLRKSRPEDSGVYECQVNTDPKINRKVTLDVVSDFEDFGRSPHNDLYMVDDEGYESAVTRILGEEEQFVKTGSTVTFTCAVVVPGKTVASVEWLKNGRQVSFQADGGGIIVDTERTERKATSRLTLADVRPKDGGNYTCKPSNARSHSVALVVVEGERMQAMQRNSNSNSNAAGKFALHWISLLAACIVPHRPLR